ncbi:MAG: helix-turn-helix transcriptional regulator [Planctomycetes bacterium]|nr:helix-turn-helix transcriptional regulator [Planctomycetota bacterium]
MEFSKEILKGILETLILYVISQGPKHGYLVARTIGKMTDGKIEIQDGTLYPILHRLEKKGLITGSWVETGQTRKRKEYTLTQQGKEMLKEQAGQWQTLSEILTQVVEEVL